MSFISFGTDVHAVAAAPIPYMQMSTTMGADLPGAAKGAIAPLLAPLKYTFIAGACVGFLTGFISGVALMKWKLLLVLGVGAVILINVIGD